MSVFWIDGFEEIGYAELRKLKTLEEENQKFKQLVADLSLDKKMLQDVLSKKLWKQFQNRLRTIMKRF